MGVSRATVTRWKKLLEQEGIRGLRARPHPGRPSKLSEEQWQHLLQILQRGGHRRGIPYRALDPATDRGGDLEGIWGEVPPTLPWPVPAGAGVEPTATDPQGTGAGRGPGEGMVEARLAQDQKMLTEEGVR